ncbi:MAG: 2-succinyl-5-enolpyruvyl-6-hydroxy-3-cyclohexene-1-carboxylic-acid synthase [Myxococcota bacterium]
MSARGRGRGKAVVDVGRSADAPLAPPQQDVTEAPRVQPFRADPDAVYAFVARFFASLVASGVEHVVISPGSRSTPLAIAAAFTPGLRSWIELDERAAAYFALGIGKATRRPAALVCTSGTAAANYLPAVVEAHHARVPLVVLTADRPSELRDFGAGQTIEQPGLYGRHPRWCVEVPIPDAGEAAVRHAAILATRAVERATARPAGPVHLNWPLREPLAPTPAARALLTPAPAPAAPRFSRAEAAADPRDVEELVAAVERGVRGVVCCGPMDPDAALARAVTDFARAAGWPLFADPASSLRAGEWADAAIGLDAGDLLARAPGFAARMRPEWVVRLGDAPVSKAQRLWLEAAAPAAVWWLDEGGQWGEPSRQVTRIVQGGAAALLAAVAERLATRGGGAWGEAFRSARARGRAALEAAIRAPEAFSGLAVAAAIGRALPPGATLVASNSMPIRLLDLALSQRREPLRVLCNRGASGIDGVPSTALGVAAAEPGPTLLFTGDLAFLHDLSGLLVARREAIPLAVVVLDDDGGGIFSFLPVADQGEAVAFERLFRAPHAIDLERAAALFELDYARADSMASLEAALAHALAQPRVSLVHVRVDPDANVARFHAAMARACAAIDAGSAAGDGDGGSGEGEGGSGRATDGSGRADRGARSGANP